MLKHIEQLPTRGKVAFFLRAALRHLESAADRHKLQPAIDVARRFCSADEYADMLSDARAAAKNAIELARSEFDRAAENDAHARMYAMDAGAWDARDMAEAARELAAAAEAAAAACQIIYEPDIAIPVITDPQAWQDLEPLLQYYSNIPIDVGIDGSLGPVSPANARVS